MNIFSFLYCLSKAEWRKKNFRWVKSFFLYFFSSLLSLWSFEKWEPTILHLNFALPYVPGNMFGCKVNDEYFLILILSYSHSSNDFPYDFEFYCDKSSLFGVCFSVFLFFFNFVDLLHLYYLYNMQCIYAWALCRENDLRSGNYLSTSFQW